MADARYFPHISSVQWTNNQLETLSLAPCLAVALCRPAEEKNRLTHCATGLQGYLLWWARMRGDDDLWRGALHMTTSWEAGETPQIPCPPLPNCWGNEMGGFQRYAIAVTAKDSHLKFQILWRGFLWLGDGDSCKQFLYQNLGKRVTNAFLDYVLYHAIDPDLRRREGFALTPPPPTEYEDILLTCWADFYQQQLNVS